MPLLKMTLRKKAALQRTFVSTFGWKSSMKVMHSLYSELRLGCQSLKEVLYLRYLSNH